MISLVNRSDDVRLILNNLGLIMQGLGIITMVPAILCFIYESDAQYMPYFVVPGIITFFVG
ncbi:MAG: hypothetical protein KO463_00400 [Candidatus Methanofastidiosa archaeon]|nr:hypothetical protein [Candidatus Methanofastidiosa archaeon]